MTWNSRLLRPMRPLLVLLVALGVLVATGITTAPAQASEQGARPCGQVNASQTQVLIAASNSRGLNSIDDVLARLATIRATLVEADDPRGAFPVVYEVIVTETSAAIDRGAFTDPQWAERLAVAFSVEYFEHLNASLRGRPTTQYWDTYDALARNCDRSMARVVAQGIVTHLVDDLPRVLTEIGTTSKNRADYDTYGESLADATAQIIAVFADTYGVDVSEPLQLYFLGDIFGEKTVNRGLFQFTRTLAWINHTKMTHSAVWGRMGSHITWLAGTGAIGALEVVGLV